MEWKSWTNAPRVMRLLFGENAAALPRHIPAERPSVRDKLAGLSTRWPKRPIRSTIRPHEQSSDTPSSDESETDSEFRLPRLGNSATPRGHRDPARGSHKCGKSGCSAEWQETARQCLRLSAVDRNGPRASGEADSSGRGI